MRGKAALSASAAGSEGITPAYAGKSLKSDDADVTYKDHPRVCGEKLPDTHYLHIFLGSPPRMRGKD